MQTGYEDTKSSEWKALDGSLRIDMFQIITLAGSLKAFYMYNWGILVANTRINIKEYY